MYNGGHHPSLHSLAGGHGHHNHLMQPHPSHHNPSPHALPGGHPLNQQYAHHMGHGGGMGVGVGVGVGVHPHPHSAPNVPPPHSAYQSVSSAAASNLLNIGAGHDVKFTVGVSPREQVCAYCQRSIAKDELILGTSSLQGQEVTGQLLWSAMFVRHIACADRQELERYLQNRYSYTSIEGWNHLNEEDQRKIGYILDEVRNGRGRAEQSVRNQIDNGMTGGGEESDEKKKKRSINKTEKKKKKKKKRTRDRSSSRSSSDSDDSDDNKPTKKKKKLKKDPNQPRRPQTGYMFYTLEKRNEVKTGSPELKQTEIMKKLAEQWNKLTTEEKTAYSQKQELDRQRYKRERTDWLEKGEYIDEHGVLKRRTLIEDNNDNNKKDKKKKKKKQKKSYNSDSESGSSSDHSDSDSGSDDERNHRKKKSKKDKHSSKEGKNKKGKEKKDKPKKDKNNKEQKNGGNNNNDPTKPIKENNNKKSKSSSSSSSSKPSSNNKKKTESDDDIRGEESDRDQSVSPMHSDDE